MKGRKISHEYDGLMLAARERMQTRLAEYVRRELAGEDADAIDPELAFHIETSPEIKAAYYKEFHRQGMSRKVAV